MELKEVQEQIANDEEIYGEYSKSELYAMAEREEGKEEGREEGREEVREEGASEARKAIASALKASGMDVAQIAQITGLDLATINSL